MKYKEGLILMWYVLIINNVVQLFGGTTTWVAAGISFVLGVIVTVIVLVLS